MKSICLNCSLDVNGRSDKKFCDDQCRSSYNHRRKLTDNRYFKGINFALKKNRQILIDLNPNGKTKVLYSEMIQKGFDFGYFTSIFKTRSNNLYYFCYEMGYLQISKEIILLVRKEDHPRMMAASSI